MQTALIIGLLFLGGAWFGGLVDEHTALSWGVGGLLVLALLKVFDWLTIKPKKK